MNRFSLFTSVHKFKNIGQVFHPGQFNASKHEHHDNIEFDEASNTDRGLEDTTEGVLWSQKSFKKQYFIIEPEGTPHGIFHSSQKLKFPELMIFHMEVETVVLAASGLCAYDGGRERGAPPDSMKSSMMPCTDSRMSSGVSLSCSTCVSSVTIVSSCPSLMMVFLWICFFMMTLSQKQQATCTLNSERNSCLQRGPVELSVVSSDKIQ